MNLHEEDTGPKNMRPEQMVSLKILFIYQEKLDALKQYPFYEIYRNCCTL